ncbi:hypothetical protein BGZ74_001386 [Mortierella antarctica]|nr:hypothetical protein BGZ74_001386 [Mortierella antarctica]
MARLPGKGRTKIENWFQGQRRNVKYWCQFMYYNRAVVSRREKCALPATAVGYVHVVITDSSTPVSLHDDRTLWRDLMANLPFHIPHICHSITDPLSFADLLKCILVNRHWHDTFIPILWSDAVTFRSLPRSHRKRAAYRDYSLLYYGHQGILKHAHHIRALTCQGAQSLQTLVDSFSCVNLVEINFVINLRVGSLGLDNLVDLMSVNPSLRAISIENVDLSDKATESQLHGLLNFLDRTPSINNLDIQLMYRDTLSHYGDDPTFELEIASAKRLAPSLLQQLGGLTHLRDLCLGLNEELKVDVSPFFQLSVDPVLGMPKLARLQQLKTFKVTGLRHSVGQHEIEWMRTHWPLLFSLDIPIMVDEGGHRRQAWVRDFGGLAPAYEQWYPGLKVLIPESIYGCDMCRVWYCYCIRHDYDSVGMSQVVEPWDREDEDNWDESEHEETIWAMDDEYHLSKHYNVHKCEWWPKPSRRQTQCGHRVQRH